MMCLQFHTGTAKKAADVFAALATLGAQEHSLRAGPEQAIQDSRDCCARARRGPRSGLVSRVWRWNDRNRLAPNQSSDPQRVAQHECALWVAYYRREWLRFGRTAVSGIHHVFGLPWLSTIRASWLLLRATQLWAPYPDNDPAAARRAMERFYRLLKQHSDDPFDPSEAARLEIEWWRLHRVHQQSNASCDGRALVDALAALYAYTFGVPETVVRIAAEQRALAMRYCDQWVQAGCDLESSLIAQKRAALARSYASLAAAVQLA